MCFYILAVFSFRWCIMNNLFSVDLAKMNYKEIADWIIKCRNEIKKENCENLEKYYIDLENFCNEWEKHSEANKSIYQSEKYKKAIVYVSYRDMISFHFDFGNGKETINPFIYNFENSIFASNKIETELSQQFNKYYDKLIKVFEQDEVEDTEKEAHKKSYKEKLHDILVNERFNTLRIRTRVFVNNKWLKSASYDEFLKECDNQRNYEIEFIDKISKGNSGKAMDEYGISSTNYNEYMSESKCEQEFGKKMFVNIAFALSLPYTYAERLLNFNGSTMKYSDRIFDIICKKAFFIGFSRDMANDLIKKKNLEIKNDFATYREIPNLDKNRK